MRRVRRTFEGLSGSKRLMLGLLLVGLCGAVYAGLATTGKLVGLAVAQPNRQRAAQTNDTEVPGSRGAKAPTDLNQIDEGPPQLTPAKPATPPPPVITCCTPGKDCPCTPGVDCPCTAGVDCACTPGKDCACTPGVNCPAKAPQRSDFCLPGVNCPCSGANCSHCTIGVNCPCTPYIDCPDNDGVLFDTDSADIRADTREKLVKFATEYKKSHQLIIVDSEEVKARTRPDGKPLSLSEQETEKDKDTRIRVEGHVTEDEMNRDVTAQVRLAVARAAAVKKALIDAGLPEPFVASASGYGYKCQITYKTDPNEVLKNRAVQLVFERDRPGCNFDELKIRRPMPLPKFMPKEPGAKGPATGVKGTAGRKGAPGAGPKPAGTK